MSIILNAKTYHPEGFDANAVSVYSEKSAGVPAGYAGLNWGQSRTDQYIKGTVRLTIPTVATTDSDCSCAGSVLRTMRMRLELEKPLTGTLAERTDILEQLRDLVLTPQFENFVLYDVKPTT